jgi:hypothetical protein
MKKDLRNSLYWISRLCYGIYYLIPSLLHGIIYVVLGFFNVGGIRETTTKLMGGKYSDEEFDEIICTHKYYLNHLAIITYVVMAWYFLIYK